LDDARGDTIAVGRFAFDHTLVEEATAAFKQEASRDQLMGYARIALPVVAVVVGLVLFRLLMRSVASHSDGYRFAGGQAALVDGRAGAIALGAGESAIRALPAPSAEMRSEMEQHVTKLISTQPQMVSDVMQAWIREDA
jgi:flagellar biosynthesis/type III secretory pathway M-ring protein FliF/YscJ